MANAIWTVKQDMGVWIGCWQQVTPMGRVVYVLEGDMFSEAELDSHDYFEEEHERRGNPNYFYDEGDE